MLCVALLLNGCEQAQIVVDTGPVGIGYDPEETGDGTADSGTDSGDDTGPPADNDGDGWTEDEDCNDDDATVHPGVGELCDRVDNDCDGAIDEDGGSTWYLDADADGWGTDAFTAIGCEAPAGYVADSGDCDDADVAYHPAAEESDCTDPNDYNCDGSVGYADVDGDGYAACEECDDSNGAVNPVATEVCNDIDDDCDGVIDPDTSAGAATWYIDADGDLYGSDNYTTVACDQPAGYVADATDCVDLVAAVNPGATEVCNAIDDDCDGTIDENDASDASVWYADADADGYGDASTGVTACDPPAGYVAEATDCDDALANVNSGAAEVCDGLDNDCDGTVDEDVLSTFYADADEDGYGDDTTAVSACEAAAGYAAYGGDCDDADAAYNPGASEPDCTDPNDYNCDGSVGYVDGDGDGYAACAECDDTLAAVNPDAMEVCDGIDNDCDGTLDDASAADASTWYADADKDGYGTINYTTIACTAPSGYVADATDCSDIAASVNPGATEVCDGLDNDCDGTVDESDAADASTWYADADADGYGFGAGALVACDQPAGYVADGSDCNDFTAAANPGAAEVCDGMDNDCDGSVDEGVTTLWYADGDGDGYGYGYDASTTSACDAPAGYVAIGGDCNDSDPAYNPGATEVCTDPADYNCDGSVGYADADGDGWAACEECDDTNAAINPAATEVCDSVDNDCDSSIDEGVTSTFYADADQDGYGDPASTTAACAATLTYVADSTDCDDTDGAVNPGATELCDGIDNDCDGTVDEADAADATSWYIDADRDGYGNASIAVTACDAPAGYVANATDCNDAAAAVNPAATEVCDSIDNDCDGSIDEGVTTTYYADVDGDTYGNPLSTTQACSRPSGYVTNSTDCDDTNAAVHPGATEVSYNGIDDNCDGAQDAMLAADETGWTVIGTGSSDAIGASVAALDDLDGDGDGELVIGAPTWDEYATNDGGLAFHDIDVQDNSADFDAAYLLVVGEDSDDYFGGAFVVLGDVDGDGDTELAASSYQEDRDGTDDGRTYIFDVDGRTGTRQVGDIEEGNISGDGSGFLGYSLAAGDMDGDGETDLAMGAPNESSARGLVYVCMHSDDYWDAGWWGGGLDSDECSYYIAGVSASDHLGYSLAFGDFNDDGYDDLAACSPDDDDSGSASGTCWVDRGSSSPSARGTTVSSLDEAKITGAAASDRTGQTNQSLVVGDFDGDLVDDLAVGVPGYDGASTNGGGVAIYAGASLSGSLTLTGADWLVLGDGALGTGLWMGGDVDGDGTSDLLAGATSADSAGVLYLLTGGQASGSYTLPDDQYASWTGEAASDSFGSSVGGLFDLDADGTEDFAVSAPGNDKGASGAGKVYVLPAY